MPEAEKTLKLISILLGCIAIADSTVLGIYVASYCLILAFIDRFLTEAIAVIILTIASTTLLLFGSFSISRDRFVPGGICNVVAGTITIAIYLYYTLDFSILQRFGLLGYFLLLPAPLSGIVSIMTKKMNPRSRVPQARTNVRTAGCLP